MAETTNIEWTDATWNPITGCSVHSAGCTNCYAMKLAGTRMKHHPSRAGLTIDTKAGPVWNGQVKLNEDWLDQPVRWSRPRTIFVCAHADLFHENVPDEWIDRVFAVMALAQHHRFQVLTKRADRMAAYMAKLDDFALQESDEWREAAYRVDCDDDDNGSPTWHAQTGRLEQAIDIVGSTLGQGKPLPNVWLGVSVEDQRAADERIPHLLATPAALRFLSMEPLLGPVAFDPCDLVRLDWVIVGGESGPGARPMHPAWAQQLRDQCAVAGGVPFFFKQWGEWLPWQPDVDNHVGWHSQAGGWIDRHNIPDLDGDTREARLWTDKLFYEGDDSCLHQLVGRKAAGRLLDGVQHDGMPA